LAIVDRAADAAIEVRRRRRRLDLHGIPKIDAVRLSQMPIERFEAIPDVNDLGVIRHKDPVYDTKAP